MGSNPTSGTNGDLLKWLRGLFAKQLGVNNLHPFDPDSLRHGQKADVVKAVV